MTDRADIVDLAGEYLTREGSYVAALSLLLADLGRAYNGGRNAECDRLIDAMNELRVRVGAAPSSERTNYAGCQRNRSAAIRAA